MMTSWCSQRTTFSAFVCSERFDQLSVNRYLTQRKCVYPYRFFLHILMTEWMCWYTPVWIRRGDPLQKAFLEEWEKVDVG